MGGLPGGLLVSALLAGIAGTAMDPLRAEAAEAAPLFLPGLEDVPLMPGLAPVAADSLVFDKPDGRIVQAAAEGQVGLDALRAFYAQTLPQLGWRPARAEPGQLLAWERDGERLALSTAGTGSRLRAFFVLAPAGAGPSP